MPNKFVTLDTGFPTFSNNATTTEKVDGIMSYLYQLQESLRYMFRHLGSDNFDEAGLMSISEPISIMLREDFNSTSVNIDASGIEAVIEGLESTLNLYVKSDVFETTIEALNGDFSTLEQTVGSFSTRIETAEKNASEAKQTADSFSTRITTAEGNASEALQTANSFSTRITTAEGNASSAVQTANSLKTTVSSQGSRISTLEQTSTSLKSTVSSHTTKISTLEQTSTSIKATVEDLDDNMSTTLHLTARGLKIGSSNGTSTTIDGGYITAGSITADKLNVGEIIAGKLQSNVVEIRNEDDMWCGSIEVAENTSTGDGLNLRTEWGGLRLTGGYGNVFLKSWKNLADEGDPTPQLLLGLHDTAKTYVCALSGGPLVVDGQTFGDSLPSNPVYGQVYFLRV